MESVVRGGLPGRFLQVEGLRWNVGVPWRRPEEEEANYEVEAEESGETVVDLDGGLVSAVYSKTVRVKSWGFKWIPQSILLEEVV